MELHSIEFIDFQKGAAEELAGDCLCWSEDPDCAHRVTHARTLESPFYIHPPLFLFLNFFYIFRVSEECWLLSFRDRAFLFMCLICWRFFSLCVAPIQLGRTKSEKKNWMSAFVITEDGNKVDIFFLLHRVRVRWCRNSHSSGSVVVRRDKISCKMLRHGEEKNSLRTTQGWRMWTVLPRVKINKWLNKNI